MIKYVKDYVSIRDGLKKSESKRTGVTQTPRYHTRVKKARVT
jgi:hypothetical protein